MNGVAGLAPPNRQCRAEMRPEDVYGTSTTVPALGMLAQV